MDGDKIRCPCRNCKNAKFRTLNNVSYHLCLQGFMPKYYKWTSYDEKRVQDYVHIVTTPPVQEEQTPAAHEEGNYSHWGDEQQMDWAQRMVYDATGPVHIVDQALWNGCTQSQLRLYASRAIAEHMTWHATHQLEEGSMCHPSDAEVWKHFDPMYPDFAEEPRNIRLGLCADGFALHRQYGRTY
ncbi:UNVERIFIED_CONTAM: hypothetical protein Sradi_3186500 [Sesamum radiatum]|uniref:Transposase-associated domain-containing protein n=1 Tax=Sesamum radiatum TaxID=300843 RepID=A0AAW2REQ3_SESRA